MIRILNRTSGFTLIEIIVGMMIFSIGMTGILALLHSTINNSLYSRHEIIVANLLREEIELVKNMRNSNVREFLPFDRALVEWAATVDSFSGIFLIENDTTSSGLVLANNGSILKSPIFLHDVSLWFPWALGDRYAKSRLYLDGAWRFTHTVTATGTTFASYIIISPLSIPGVGNVTKNGKNQWYNLDARVIVNSRGYNEYDLKTVITDWKH